MGPGQLARVCIWAKDVSWAVVGSVDLGDLAGRRISNQLQQRNSTVFWKERKKKSNVRPANKNHRCGLEGWAAGGGGWGGCDVRPGSVRLLVLDLRWMFDH